MGTKFSCKDCKDRKVGCHGTCEKYIAEKQKYLERVGKIKKEKAKAKAVETVCVEGTRRMKSTESLVQGRCRKR